VVAAARALTALGGMFAWGVASDLVETNPTIGTKRPKEPEARDRVLSDDELAAIWRATGDGEFGTIVRLLVLTGQRRGEVGGMTWAELDDHGMWTIPRQRTKNKRAHTLQLPPMALDIIGAVPKIAGRPQLFGDRSSTGYTCWVVGKQELDT